MAMTPPPRIDDVTENLLRMLYVSEIYNAEMYALMLEAKDGLSPEHRRKLEACRRLELTMGRKLHDHLTIDLGVTAGTPPRARRAARSFAPPPRGSWRERMSELEGASNRGVTSFRALKVLYGERQPHLCATLLAHEMALRDFARDELDGETDHSLCRILSLLTPDDRDAIVRFAG